MRRYWAERLTALCCIAVSLYFGIVALDFPAGGGSFPLFATTMTVFLSVVMIVVSYINTGGAMAERLTFDLSYAKLKPLIVCALVIVYVFAIFRLGYYVSSFLFLAISTWVVGIRRAKAVGLTAAILFPAMYGFFEFFLKADIPRGVLF